MSERPPEDEPEGGDPDLPDATPGNRRVGDWVFDYVSGIERVQRADPKDPEPVADSDDLEQADRAQDIALKKVYAYSMLVGLGVLLLITETLFALYAHVGMHWRVPDAVVIAWLSSTVVEVVAIVLVITRYLFPPRS